jgi:tetratricopeptide (TPR) repeat protein
MAKVVQITAENFETEVIQASETRAVAILFSSAEYPDCAPYSQLLGQLSTSMDFTLGVVSCDDRENMRLIQMFRVQSVPEIHVVDKGQIADVIQGVLPEADLKKRLEKFFVSDEQRFQTALEDAIAQKNFDQALPMLDEALSKTPNDKKLQLLWAKVNLGLGDTAKAKDILATMHEEKSKAYYYFRKKYGGKQKYLKIEDQMLDKALEEKNDQFTDIDYWISKVGNRWMTYTQAEYFPRAMYANAFHYAFIYYETMASCGAFFPLYDPRKTKKGKVSEKAKIAGVSLYTDHFLYQMSERTKIEYRS